MSEGPTFEAYLVSKKIDSNAFRSAEPDLWRTWKEEFEEMHPNSFTVQKLNLINPIRRKYHLAITEEEKKAAEPSPTAQPKPISPKPGRPIIRPKTS
jgi:hypothetical protein